MQILEALFRVHSVILQKTAKTANLFGNLSDMAMKICRYMIILISLELITARNCPNHHIAQRAIFNYPFERFVLAQTSQYGVVACGEPGQRMTEVCAFFVLVSADGVVIFTN